MPYPHLDPYARFHPIASPAAVAALVHTLSKGLEHTDGEVWTRGAAPRLADIMAWRALVENGGLGYETWWMHCDSIRWTGEATPRSYRDVPKAFEDLRAAERFADALGRDGGFTVRAYTLTKRSFGSRRLIEASIETECGVHDARWCENEAYALSLAALAAYLSALTALADAP